MGDEVPLLILQRLPVLQVLGQVHLDVEHKIQTHNVTMKKCHTGLYPVSGPPTSSAVQKDASAFLYICQMSWYWIGKMTKRRGFSFSSGSTSFSPVLLFTGLD